MIRLPEDFKEYLVIYTTEYDDTYLLEPIVADDLYAMKDIVENQEERVLEVSFNYDISDWLSTIIETERILKIRKLNKKIGDNFKMLYDYRCKICGMKIDEEYGANIIE